MTNLMLLFRMTQGRVNEKEGVETVLGIISRRVAGLERDQWIALSLVDARRGFLCCLRIVDSSSIAV